MKLIACLGMLVALARQPADYRAEVEAFRQHRAVEIGGEMGWASLTGLHWLTPGAHTIGRAASNDVMLTAPSAPLRLGTIDVRADAVVLHPAADVEARVRDRAVTSATLQPDMSSDAAVHVGDMAIALIKRGDRLALRVWDRRSPTRVAFQGLRWYAIDPTWRVTARFIPHTPAPRQPIMNVLGEQIAMRNPGALEFVVDGRTWRLEAFLESDDAHELFLMFRDGTSGKTTYGAGRYLYTDLPANGQVVVDFNRAMNPPCAFTSFATCPLPPLQNRLTLPIPAGELDHKKTSATGN